MVTQQRLKEVLEYDPETGVFTWAVSDRMKRVGAKAGFVHFPHKGSTGHVLIQIDGKRYVASRLAWLYVHGEWPKDVIDHKNGDWTDNKFSNLRDVPQLVNVQNQRRPRSDSKTGYLGVRRNGSAIIQDQGKQHYLGQYRSPEQAHEAYLKAKRVMHEGCTI